MTPRRCGDPDRRGRSPTWLALSVQIGAPVGGLLALLIVSALAVGGVLPPGDEIAYLAITEGDIKVVDVDRALTATLAHPEHGPYASLTWLPDGSGLIFTARLGDTLRIVTLDIESGVIQPLLDEDAAPFSSWIPTPSPDGAWLAFMSYWGSTNRRALFLADLNNPHDVRWLTDADVQSLAWSPDGRWLAFVASATGQVGAYLDVMDVSSDSRPRRLVDGLGMAPSWSPDSRQIVFQSSHTGRSQLYVVDVSSGKMRALTVGEGANFEPVWSPVGNQIVFHSARDGDSDIYMIDGDGGGLHALTHNTVSDVNPTWSPDGRRLAFISYDNSYIRDYGDIYVIDADGSNLRRLINNPFADGFPAWRPEPAR